MGKLGRAIQEEKLCFNIGEITGLFHMCVWERSLIRSFVCGYGFLGIFVFMFSW